MAMMTEQQAQDFAAQIAAGTITMRHRTFDQATVDAHPEMDLKDRWYATFDYEATRYWMTNTDDPYAIRVIEQILAACKSGQPLVPAKWSDQTITPARARIPRFSF